MAEKSDILDAIEALAVHCRPPLMSLQQKAVWMGDWCADLAEFPLEAIANACRKWRHSGSTKFPTAGQLLPMVRDGLPNDPAPAIEPWRPLSDAEYEALTLRDKIRHHQILASQAYGRAGPMFRNTSGRGPISKASGIHLKPEDMPDTWRRWREIAKGHEQEAYRLRQYLTGKPSAVAAQ